MKKSLGFACFMLTVLSALPGRGEMPPTVAALSDAQRAALQQAVRFAESREVVQTTFADLAAGPAGTSQQDVLRSKLASDNLSMFCTISALNREGNETEFEYASPALEMITASAEHTVANASVVDLADVAEVTWQDDAPGQAHGSFLFDTKSGYKGVCLFQAKQDGETWNIARLAIQKKGSGRIEDGYPVFDRTVPTE